MNKHHKHSHSSSAFRRFRTGCWWFVWWIYYR